MSGKCCPHLREGVRAAATHSDQSGQHARGDYRTSGRQHTTAVRHVLQTSDDALSAFEQLAADDPAVANQVLFSAVGALANLQATLAVNTELKRRAERN